MHRPPRKLETPRLILRKPVMEDVLPIFEQYAQDGEVTNYLTWQAHADIKETRKFIQRCIAVWKDGTAFPWSIIRIYDDQLLGMIEMINIDFSGITLGFALAKPYWGQGYMPEALRGIIEWCFRQDDIYRVWAFCDVENHSSARALEKAGMHQEGILKKWISLPQYGKVPRDCYCYAMVK
jgi:ribosomal-protein-alanine N-acetyltransferase